MTTVKQYKIKVENQTVDREQYLYKAIRQAKSFLERGRRAHVSNYRNGVIWRPSDIIEEE